MRTAKPQRLKEILQQLKGNKSMHLEVQSSYASFTKSRTKMLQIQTKPLDGSLNNGNADLFGKGTRITV